VRETTFFRVVLRAIGPYLMGFGTIFQPKARPDDHWSADPRVTIQVEASIDESGDPPDPTRRTLHRRVASAA
jgi:hypothetical protein